MLGDNRAISEDSRIWGLEPRGRHDRRSPACATGRSAASAFCERPGAPAPIDCGSPRRGVRCEVAPFLPGGAGLIREDAGQGGDAGRRPGLPRPRGRRLAAREGELAGDGRRGAQHARLLGQDAGRARERGHHAVVPGRHHRGRRRRRPEPRLHHDPQGRGRRPAALRRPPADPARDAARDRRTGSGSRRRSRTPRARSTCARSPPPPTASRRSSSAPATTPPRSASPSS